MMPFAALLFAALFDGAPNPVTLNAWMAGAMIAAVVLTSTTGEVLTAAAMKSIGDLDVIRVRSGLPGAIRAVLTSPLFFAGVFFLTAVCSQSSEPEPGSALIGFADAGHQHDRRQNLPQGKCGPAQVGCR